MDKRVLQEGVLRATPLCWVIRLWGRAGNVSGRLMRLPYDGPDLIQGASKEMGVQSLPLSMSRRKSVLKSPFSKGCPTE